MEDNIRCVFPFEVLFKQFSFLQGVVTNRKSASKFLLHKCILCSVLFYLNALIANVKQGVKYIPWHSFCNKDHNSGNIFRILFFLGNSSIISYKLYKLLYARRRSVLLLCSQEK